MDEISAAINLAYVVWRLIVRPAARVYLIPLGDFGGFYVSEAILIADSILAVGLMYARLGQISRRTRPLWHLFTGIFVVGTLLATASNKQVDLRILAYHATWYIVGAFGFIVLWVFDHTRFADPQLSPLAEGA